ncbi:serine hydrolase domain-containing protein [Fictibacillus terranigra]|uniref:Serine hydrolase domain-containing protein n=1 Tax=Fictibacillus terranigra TaxID=3058424 RepID=A0ABT8E888_9BACL|nr:serine hydrolase domain-containing protein [Fictibacillus sp. CENA-BCM004]MDN4074105.1 serine hydrolase domain-containing protein [Fictibacillus sp. CENA-BCM004]
MNKQIIEYIQSMAAEIHFSGSVFVKQGDKILADCSFGLANRSEMMTNVSDTKFGIASGSKLFTAIAICQLVEEGRVSYHSLLGDCLNLFFPHFSQEISIHQLLTHTSGIPDYFDEEVMEDYEELWINKPMYHVRGPEDLLPFFQNERMKHSPGSEFHYNNAGFILLGLIIEQVSGMSFTDYVEKNIFQRVGLDAGYFETDRLPSKTALGYIDQSDGSWKTNIFSLPAKGGPDGGAYTTACGMIQLWEALTEGRLLDKKTVQQLLTPHTMVDDSTAYGYGIWMKTENHAVTKYILMGYDPGVNFRAAFHKHSSLSISVCSNQSGGAFEMIKGIESEVMKEITS